jgi:acetyl-CoA acyltransferase
MNEAYIVSAVRTPVGKAPRGALRTVRPDDLAALAIGEALRRVPEVTPEQVEDVVLGCAMPEGAQGMNVARLAALRAGLPVDVPAVTVNRFCASGAETIARAAQQIGSGMADVVLAGGTESMSLVPMGGRDFVPNPRLVDEYPDVYLSMGLTAENLAERYRITREEADAFALRSHENALAAIREGRFTEESVAVPVRETTLDGAGRKLTRETTVTTDEGPRADTSAEALAKLHPVFHAHGTVTAGNASQTSDGAATLLLLSEPRMKELGVRPLARFVSYAAAGVPPEIMGIGPVAAIPKALHRAGLSLDEIDLIELNEAFACQALAVIRAAGLPLDKVNVNGGAVALGHPLGATGAKLACTLLYELKRRGGRYGLVTMCVGGGMGGALVLENLA